MSPDTPVADPVVRATEWTVPPHWRAIDILSDLHLGADTPRTFAAWRDHLEHTDADCVVLLGDWFEVWVGDDLRDEGIGAQCVAVLQRVTRERTVCFMAGNRDFILGADMLAACGMTGLDDPTVVEAFGERVLLTHGDALCLADTTYQQFRRMVRDPAWRRQALALPRAERVKIGAQMRTASETQQHGRSTPAAWADVDFPEALRWMDAARATTLVHGHTHRPGTEALAPGRLRHVLTDWDLDHPPHRAEVLRWSAAGLHRVAPATASAR